MKSFFTALSLSLALLLPISAAHAGVSVSPVSDQTVNAGGTITVNVVAVDTEGRSITLTSSLPTFATLNTPTTGTGHVVTTLTITPADGDIGAHSASITATAGEESETENFQITVAASGTNQAPRVTAPPLEAATEASLLTFAVTASDPDDDAITGLVAVDLPAGASFTPNGTFTSGSFSWTPGLAQAGEYDVIFVASNALSDSATTHISVAQSNLGPPSITPIADVTLEEGATAGVDVIATDPDKETITLTSSLPAFATLNPPTTSTGLETLATTITIAPGAGTAGLYDAWVTATSGADAATDSFTITVTAPPPPELAATATLIGAFNTHKKFLCFKVVPVESSFDLLQVNLSSITLNFNGNSISTVKPTHLAFDCDDEGDDEDAAALAATDGGDDGDDCEECSESDSTGCEPSHIMACFSMSDIRGLFEGVALPDSFADATIEGQLKDGQTFVATFGGNVHVPPGQIGKGNEGEKGKGKIHLFVRPNPMNPKADIVFTLSQSGAVRVSIFDLRGRLVRTIQDGNLAAGQHSIPWEGSTASGSRAASGLYYVKVTTAHETEVLPVTVLK